jgi:hypothetical protein
MNKRYIVRLTDIERELLRLRKPPTSEKTANQGEHELRTDEDGISRVLRSLLLRRR